MSSMRKALKILSLLAFVGGIDLIVTAIVLMTGENPPEILNIVVIVLAAIFALLLGGMGIGAANVPVKAAKMLPIIIVGLLVSAADVVLAIMSGVAVVSICINALIVVGIAYTAHVVNKEYLAKH